MIDHCTRLLWGMVLIDLATRRPTGAPKPAVAVPNAFVPIWLWGFQANNGDALTGAQCCVFESEIICPPAGVILVDQCSLIAGGGYQVGTIILCGIKRYKNDVCCGEVCRA